MGDAYPLFHPSFNRSIQVEARDERLTSDAGLILLREVGERLGIFERLAPAPRPGPDDVARREAGS